MIGKRETGNERGGAITNSPSPITFISASGFGDALLKEVVERNGVVADEVCDLVVERGEDGFIRGDERGFVAVASGKVL